MGKLLLRKWSEFRQTGAIFAEPARLRQTGAIFAALERSLKIILNHRPEAPSLSSEVVLCTYQKLGFV